MNIPKLNKLIQDDLWPDHQNEEFWKAIIKFRDFREVCFNPPPYSVNSVKDIINTIKREVYKSI